jgi:tetratricopeptide (TPR) repeat protein
MEELPGYRFALATFSGSAAMHLPMIDDHDLFRDALESVTWHSNYRNTGSSILSALNVVSHFIDPARARLQVVLMSDGEQPRKEDYKDALEALGEQGVPVHTVAIGTPEGEGRLIYDFHDVVAGKEEKRVIKEFHTRRVDKHLKRISRRTGGTFLVADDLSAETLGEDIRAESEKRRPVEHEEGRRSLSPALMLLVLLLFLLDRIWIARPRPSSPERFDLRRLGGKVGPGESSGRSTAALLTLLAAGGFLLACGDSPQKQAHRANETGIEFDNRRLHAQARPYYERSIAFEIEAHIPTHNLARSVALQGDYSEAHEIFQQALLRQPDMTPALFNDGVTLYLWGAAERDPKNCDLERTRELWRESRRRFASAQRVAGEGSALRRPAEVNGYHLGRHLAEIRRLIEEPPEHCLSEAEREQSSAASGSEGESEAEGGAEEEDQHQPEAEEDPSEGKPDEEESEDSRDEEKESSEEPEAREEEEEESPEEPDEEEDGEEQGEEDSEEGEEDEAGPGGEDEEEGRSGSSGDENEEPEHEGEASGTRPQPLSAEELASIREQIGALKAQAKEEGKFHWRARSGQMHPEDWGQPEDTLWW